MAETNGLARPDNPRFTSEDYAHVFSSIVWKKKVAVIIDCIEIFIDRLSNLSACASTWSNYKHHNTAKVLLGIVPQGCSR